MGGDGLWYDAGVIGERAPAPGRLALLQAFVNSVDLELDTDDLSNSKAATAWLNAHGVGARRLSEVDRRRLVAVREGLRELLASHPPPTAVAASRLERLLGKARFRLAVSASGGALVAEGDDVDAFFGELAAIMVEAGIDGRWQRLKVCRNDLCRWAYYDHSKNGRGSWCTMRTCGSRAKARAYRARQRTT